MLVNVKYKCYETGYAKLSEKVTFFKKYLLLKRFFFWKSSCSEEVHILNNYLFWKKRSSETVGVLEKYLSSMSCWLEKTLLPRTTHKKEVAAPEGILKKIYLRKSSCFKRLLSCHYNRCCSGNTVASIWSLFHGDWYYEVHWKKVR